MKSNFSARPTTGNFERLRCISVCLPVKIQDGGRIWTEILKTQVLQFAARVVLSELMWPSGVLCIRSETAELSA